MITDYSWLLSHSWLRLPHHWFELVLVNASYSNLICFQIYLSIKSSKACACTSQRGYQNRRFSNIPFGLIVSIYPKEGMISYFFLFMLWWMLPLVFLRKMTTNNANQASESMKVFILLQLPACVVHPETHITKRTTGRKFTSWAFASTRWPKRPRRLHVLSTSWYQMKGETIKRK